MIRHYCMAMRGYNFCLSEKDLLQVCITIKLFINDEFIG